MFPLNTVLFPGVTVPLRVFEDRYRALVHRLLRIEDPAERLFGSVAIREGYEVGERGGQSVHRIGCLLQLTEVEPHDDLLVISRGKIVARGTAKDVVAETGAKDLGGAFTLLIGGETEQDVAA